MILIRVSETQTVTSTLNLCDQIFRRKRCDAFGGGFAMVSQITNYCQIICCLKGFVTVDLT